MNISDNIFRIIDFCNFRHSVSKCGSFGKHNDLSNHHKMLNDYKGDKQYLYDYCIGGKTGYTSVAGSTLATFAEKDGMTLICVVTREQAPNHYQDTRALFDYCFENFQLWNVAENEKNYSQDIKENKIFENEDSFVGLNKEGNSRTDTACLPCNHLTFYDGCSDKFLHHAYW